MANDRDPPELSLEALFRRESSDLIRYLTGRTGDPELAADLAQETWVRVLRSKLPADLKEPGAFIRRIANNLSIDEFRRERLNRDYMQARAVTSEENPAATPSLDRDVAAREHLQKVNATLSTLPPTTRQVFAMSRQQALPYPEIGRQLGISTSMVEKHMIEALRRLRQLDAGDKE